ncbi:hypothetical protein [Nocardioides pakistanensis]
MDANAAAEDNRPLRDGMPRAATAIAVAAWGLAVLATVLLVSGRPPVNDGLWFFLVDVTVACVYGTVGSLILARRRHPVAWILAVAALGGGLAALGFGAGMAAGRHPGLAFAEPLAPLQGIAWVPGTLSLFLVVPWLVRNHRLGAAVWGAVAGAAITVAVTAMRIFLPSAQGVWLFAAAVTVGLAAAAEAEWRHRRGPVAERNGLGWLALGTSILAISFIPLALPWGMLPLPIWTTPALHLASQAVFPAAVLVAVLRGRMWGLDLLVSRAVVAGLLTVLLVGLYLGVTLALTRVLPGEGTAHLVAAGAVAVAVQPARLRLQRHVHRLVHGSAGPTRPRSCAGWARSWVPREPRRSCCSAWPRTSAARCASAPWLWSPTGCRPSPGASPGRRRPSYSCSTGGCRSAGSRPPCRPASVSTPAANRPCATSRPSSRPPLPWPAQPTTWRRLARGWPAPGWRNGG